ncbi:DUF3566 domain-containing protein [Bifidobacterium psychraerophilum]|jgi:hypothetical protein|uniref:DUF3566 domain-containing protein n=1 Tax=Bifidobacterium psychraerophilum TaxID=218140 RepID=UPI0023F4F92F|nr:DUF3566 domain-containing protein [Bifidobacterium psychraerophilum]MCI1659582.1 DUF3566 domain-containing protein [Bifidobacterium psychraerophilum]MCI1804450.1 DUF3566 domain-containing protein [Bifidobacterium psychraerophilum]MCI2176393.1 DUF3566 domain-containing protein [Bifidobacterium psychraerophilum]MCI2181133.1 DUF3566 domain-containing protein [Bifidobacterium psychraerophilum]
MSQNTGEQIDSHEGNDEHQEQPGRTARSFSSKPLISTEAAKEHEAESGGSKPIQMGSFKQSPSLSANKKPSVPRARRMRLSLTRIDPWSITKVSFLLAIAGAIIQIVAVALIWLLLNSIGLFDNVTQLISKTGLDAGGFDLSSVLSLSTVLSAVTIFSIFEVVLVVVLATIVAFLYNIVSALVGGVHVTLGDD